MEVERANSSNSSNGVPLKTVVMKSTKRTLDMFVGQEGAPPPACMGRYDGLIVSAESCLAPSRFTLLFNPATTVVGATSSVIHVGGVLVLLTNCCCLSVICCKRVDVTANTKLYDMYEYKYQVRVYHIYELSSIIYEPVGTAGEVVNETSSWL